jgi:S1-C subfamily serine protease
MLVSVPSADSFAAMEWASPRSQGPQYVFVTVPSAVGVALRPVFIPGLDMVTRRTWSGLVWKATPGTDLDPGAFVFTTAGDFAGLVIDDAGDRVIVGGDVLRAEIDVLRNRPPRARGELGLEVQVLTPAIASATGSSGGVVVTWVDPEGAAGGILAAGDVIEWVDGARAASEEWAFRSGRVTVDEMITLRVRRKREVQEIGLVARSPAAPRIETLGLTLRALPGVGSEVIRVVARGAGERAGVKPGDVITRAGNAQTPTPSQIRATYAADQEQRGVLIALTRGITHHVAVLER